MDRRAMERNLKVSLNVLLLLAVCVAGVAYLVSPLRDPSFIPEAANASATVDWLSPERYWLAVRNIFAIALATNFSLLAWCQSRFSRPLMQTARRRPLGRLIGALLKVLGLSTLWLIVAYGTWVASTLFLLDQWIVD